MRKKFKVELFGLVITKKPVPRVPPQKKGTKPKDKPKERYLQPKPRTRKPKTTPAKPTA